MRAADLEISEFMASNSTILTDEDGDSPDWIEIRNTTAAPVDVGGWHLTDSASSPTKWTFPARTIPAGDHLVVFASDKDRAGATGELHTNFKLSASGEYLALLEPGGATVASEFAPAYPQQVADVSFGPQVAGTVVVNLTESSDARVLVPADGGLGLTWTAPGFTPGAGWINGSGQGVGFDTTPKYLPYISTDIGAQMADSHPTAYIRLPFTLADASLQQDLALHIRWEDGFVAYLNGTQVASRNAPGSPAWNSTSLNGSNRSPESEVLIPEVIDLGAHLAELEDGDNVLAIHGLNSSSGSSDLLVESELRSTRLGGGATTFVYFTVPSPGSSGSPGEPTLAALLSDETHVPAVPAASDPVTVTARVVPVSDPLDSVTLHHRTMFEPEATVPMFDDGNHGDGAAGDGVFGAIIPAGTADAGEMLRWYITATDTGGGQSRWPPFAPGARTAEYFGTVVANPSITSGLPLLQYFIEDTDWFIEPGTGHYNKDYTTASVAHLGRFYDNVRVKLRGSSSVWWKFPKQSLHFDFPSGNRFYRGDAFELYDEININQLWTDKAYIRNQLSMLSVYKAAGCQYVDVFPMLTHYNGAFHSVAIFIEEPDELYLERHGLDPDGAFYKMQSPLTSAAVYPDFVPGRNPDTVTGAKKRTREHEDHSDLQAIVSGTAPGAPGRAAFLYDHFDVPQIINYMAASVLVQDWDRFPKNHFMYRDTEGTGLWQMHPWDADLSWGYAGWMTDSITTSHATMSHPLYGESGYPGVYGQTHRLVDAFHDQPSLREMFLRRLRSVMDLVLQPPSTPAAERILEAEVELLYSELHVDVDADKAKWGNPFGSPQTLRQALDSMVDNYIVPRRQKLYNPALYGGIIPAAQPANPTINFGTIVANPGSNQAEEYAVIANPNSYAVDISGWRIDGGIRFTFAPGTVIPSGGSAYLTPDIPAFRASQGGQSRLVLGEYKGELSARGETLTLLRTDQSIAANITYPGNPSLAQQYLRISEVHFAPTEPTAAELTALPGVTASDFEFIELVNTGPSTLDLAGCQFVDGIAYTFPAGSTLATGARLIIAANPTALALRQATAIGPWTGRLDNDGETIELLDAVGERILQFTYNDSWYRAAEDLGHSLVMRDVGTQPFDAWDLRDNWSISAAPGGTPGTDDTSYGRNYDGWAYSHFAPTETLQGPADDPDGDGFPNLVEYALGGDPTSANSQPSIDMVAQSGQIEISFDHFPATVDYDATLESSSDLTTWLPPTSGTTMETSNPDSSVTISRSMPISDRRRFYRVEISPR